MVEHSWSKRENLTLEGLLRGTLECILHRPLLFWSCVSANLLGAVVGALWWYGPMLMNSPLWALPFIPDCPLAALVANIALLGLWGHKRWPFFNALVAFACLKYGAWTVGFWLRQWSSAGVIFPIEVLLVVTHIGLFIEGLLFVPHIGPLSLPKRLAVIGWFVLSVYVDYGLGFYPPLASHVPVSFITWLATVLTVLLGAGLVVLPHAAVLRLAPDAAA
jgi:uncharacterized membrane protein YpjA